jgi:selenium metabolism protein YedF
MAKVTLDCTGLPCPQPVLRTKEALEQGATEIEVLVDNEASRNNVARFAQSRGHKAVLTTQPPGHYTIAITADIDRGLGQAPDAGGLEEYRCDLPQKVRLVYVIAADSMGRGNDELGWALLQTYIQTIKDIDPLPEKIIFYNSGVKQVTTESGALEALKQLQTKGVEILVCGTCLDFFKLKSAIKVGHISNMYDIMHSIISADKITSPY